MGGDMTLGILVGVALSVSLILFGVFLAEKLGDKS